MTKYLDEYGPNARGVNRRVQSDAGKLKFNNIQSCIAVVLAPVGGQTMVGVHFTTATTSNLGELQRAIGELGAAAGDGVCDAYLVATFGHHAGTPLVKELKKVARAVYLCDVAPDAARSADVDVKFELQDGRLTAFVRHHAVALKDAAGKLIPKPNWNAATALPGKPRNLTDRDDKPWMAVAFKRHP